MSRAVGYVRVSTEEQAQHGYSLEAQAEAIRNYCKALGWELVRIYRDEGYSASSLDRPDLQQLIQDIPLHSFDTVVFWKLDRLTRSAKDTIYLLEDVFEKNNITYVSIQEPFVNTKDPTAKMFTTIISAFAQHEREMITERMRMGKYQKARMGQFPGGHVLYGYSKNPVTGEFEVNEEEARIVKLIYHWYVYGDESGQPLGMETIADKLTQMGILPPSAVRGVRVGVRGKRGQKGEVIKHWSNATVRQILTHQAYIGKNFFGRDGKNAEPEYTKDDWIPIPFPQLIDDHLYQLAQERRKRAKFWQRTHEMPLLVGIIHCGICGLQFRGAYDHGTKPVYSCYGRLKRYHRDGSPMCGSPRLPANLLDEQVTQKVLEALREPAKMKEAIEAHLESWERRKRELELLVGPSTRQVKQLQDELGNLNYLFRKGRIPVGEYEKEASALEKQIADLREQHKHQSEELRRLQKLEQDLDFIRRALEKGYWQVGYQAIQQEVQMTWDAAATIDAATGQLVNTKPRQEKKIQVDFSQAVEGGDARDELFNLAMHGSGKVMLRQLFDRLHITVHVYHDRVEVRGLVPVGNINISSFRRYRGFRLYRGWRTRCP
ncbi:recombinase family protein [Syntrophothermus lipocalidus]|uniref:Resolvase domain protein n=1 Tax=Syntrophothermus lipocalidus (strain DSM 12680 / TGB-C1) TaxID=643648 RepID=D7CPS3_SYNLT|nr:recombinase family protein [Syntrophothermus lipocalidus]ADI02701.1 Resolvase domain protein [Syntrophothermus lipocalidus DSM 12680]